MKGGCIETDYKHYLQQVQAQAKQKADSAPAVALAPCVDGGASSVPRLSCGTKPRRVLCGVIGWDLHRKFVTRLVLVCLALVLLLVLSSMEMEMLLVFNGSAKLCSSTVLQLLLLPSAEALHVRVLQGQDLMLHNRLLSLFIVPCRCQLLCSLLAVSCSLRLLLSKAGLRIL